MADVKELYKRRLQQGQKNWNAAKKQAESFGKPFPEGEGYLFQLQGANPDEVNLSMGGTALVMRLEHVCLEGEHENEVCRTSLFLEGENTWPVADFFLRLEEGVPENAGEVLDAFEDLVKAAPQYRANVTLDPSGRFNRIQITERILDGSDAGESLPDDLNASDDSESVDEDHVALIELLNACGQDLIGQSKDDVIEFIKENMEFEYEDFDKDEVALLDRVGCADRVLNRPAPKKKTVKKRATKK